MTRPRESRAEQALGQGLEAARIQELPEAAYYISNFLTPEEEERLLQKISTVPAPRWTQLSHRRLQTWPSSLSASNTLLAAPLPPWLDSPILPRLKELSVFADSPHQAPNHVLINEYRPGQGIMPHEDGAAYHPIVATVSLGAAIVLDVYSKPTPVEKEGEEGEEWKVRVEDGRDRARGPGDDNGQDDISGHRNESTAAPTLQYRIIQEPRSLLITTKELYMDHLHGIAEREADEDLRPETIANWDLLGEKEELEREGRYEREPRISLTYRDVLKVAKVGNSLKFLTRR